MSTHRPRFAYLVQRVDHTTPQVTWDQGTKTEVHKLVIDVLRVKPSEIRTSARVYDWKWDAPRSAQGDPIMKQPLVSIAVDAREYHTCAICVRYRIDCVKEALDPGDPKIWVCGICRGDEPKGTGGAKKRPNLGTGVSNLPDIPPRHSLIRVRRDKSLDGIVDQDVALRKATERRPEARLHSSNARWFFFVYPDPLAPDFARKIR